MACGCNSSNPAKQSRQAAKERRLSYAAKKKEDRLSKSIILPPSQTAKDTFFKHLQQKPINGLNGVTPQNKKDTKPLQNKHKVITNPKNLSRKANHQTNTRPKLVVSEK